MIDSTLLQQQIAELEMELQNIRDIKELQEQKGRKGETILLKIKIPNCRYLNDVYYVRDKFEFRYEYNFFLHYFDHRYFHRKRFYDRVDSTRIVAKHVMKLVGNSKYRHTDFNKIADSVGTILPNYPVVEYLDSVITQLNLEYLATGEIKIKYRNTRQKSIYSKLKPSKIKQEGSLGDIKFYTGNRRRIIEELDASQFDSLVIADSLSIEEKALADSLNTIIKLKEAQDSIQFVQDSLESLVDSMILRGPERDSIHNKLDQILWGGGEEDSTGTDDEMDEFDPLEELQYELPAQPLSYDNLEQMILLAEQQKKNKASGKFSSGVVLPPISMDKPDENARPFGGGEVPTLSLPKLSQEPPKQEKQAAATPSPAKKTPAKKGAKPKYEPTPDMPYEEAKASSSAGELPQEDLVMSRINELMKQKQEREAIESAAEETDKKQKRKKKKKKEEEASSDAP
jgi:hypothetical protein